MPLPHGPAFSFAPGRFVERADFILKDVGGILLGSRLIDRQSQNKTVAARATTERNTFGHLS
jgi:hypothetical protein